MKFTLCICICLAVFLCYGQEPTSPATLPAAYHALKTDIDRMRFLEKAIGDSLNENQLTYVYGWSQIGLSLAQSNRNDTMKGIFYFDIAKAYTYHYNRFDSAIAYYKKTIPYFPDPMRIYNVFSIREIMDRYADLGNKDSSFAYLGKLLSLIDTMNDVNPKKITLSTNIAGVYQWFGMFKTAIHYYQIAVNGNKSIKNNRGLGLALANMAELYNEMEDPVKALQYSKEAMFYLRDVSMAYCQTAENIVEIYTADKQLDSAIAYLNIADSVADRINLVESKTLQFVLRAAVYREQKKYAEAASSLDSAFTLHAKTDNSWGLCRALLQKGLLDTTLHQYASAMQPVKRALTIAREKQFVVMIVMALQQLSSVSAKMGNYRSAYEYQNEYLSLKDSMTNAKAKSDAADLEISYQTLQKEQKINLLQTENDIKNLQLKAGRQQFLLILGGIGMLLIIGGVWFYQRQQRSKIETQKIKAELENQVLRLQMNPHFIFNSLNSIENFIMQNEKRLASDYLNKFARLIRMILDSSRNEVVPVAKDMEALQLYIDLEQLRFNHRFSYKTVIDPALASGDYRVPSLLIQPYVENAIVHGLAHSEEKDLALTVSATLEDDKIKYTVQDNGVGRAKAAMYNQQNKPYHQSVGLKITEERINLFNKNEETVGSVQFTDLMDKSNRPAGTKVEIMLNTF